MLRGREVSWHARCGWEEGFTHEKWDPTGAGGSPEDPFQLGACGKSQEETTHRGEGGVEGTSVRWEHSRCQQPWGAPGWRGATEGGPPTETAVEGVTAFGKTTPQGMEGAGEHALTSVCPLTSCQDFHWLNSTRTQPAGGGLCNPVLGVDPPQQREEPPGQAALRGQAGWKLDGKDIRLGRWEQGCLPDLALECKVCSPKNASSDTCLGEFKFTLYAGQVQGTSSWEMKMKRLQWFPTSVCREAPPSGSSDRWWLKWESLDVVHKMLSTLTGCRQSWVNAGWSCCYYDSFVYLTSMPTYQAPGAAPDT